MRRLRLALTILAGCAFAVSSGRSVTLLGQSNAIRATQNLTIDPSGRVVDVTLSQPVSLTAPWDRFRFDIDSVQPLARDSGAIFGDLTGDGIPDLILASFSGETLFFPGISGSPRRFGAGTYLQRVSAAGQDPFAFGSGDWITGDVADLDGDGRNEIIIGRNVYQNIGVGAQPRLQLVYSFEATGEFDPTASIGDLNGDGRPDVVLQDSGGSRIYTNNSTPGSFSFTFQTLNGPAGLALGDLNGDGLLDLANVTGVYFNTGTARVPQFNFVSATPWNISGVISSWLPASGSDQLGHVSLRDADGDGRLDAYVSNLGSTVWQVLFYKNTGTTASPQFSYVGPVLAASSPLSAANRGKTVPDFSPLRPYVAAADIDNNGLSDILLSVDGSDTDPLARPTILWNFPSVSGAPAAATLSYQDLYTLPALANVDYDCGAGAAGPRDALCRPPNIFSAWTDLTGDGLPDAVRSDFFPPGSPHTFYSRPRTGTWPFSLGADSAIQAAPSNNPARGYGVVAIDLDGDTRVDLVTGSEDGGLLFYRNTSLTGPATFADPVPLTDAMGVPINVGSQSWPAAIDLDGDGHLDFLVGSADVFAGTSGGRTIRQVFCVTPGPLNGCLVNGFSLGPLLTTADENPAVFDGSTGDGFTGLSITALDVDGDGLQDAVVSDTDGRVWLLRNVGSTAAAVFSRGPLTVSRTAAAFLEIIDPLHVRLSFAVPTTGGQTMLSYHDATGGSEAVVIEADPTPAITAQPNNQTVLTGQNATFTVTASGAPTLAYQWQISTDGGASWTNLADGAFYSGVLTPTLVVTAPTLGLNGTRYRVVASNSIGSATSAAATLTVTGLGVTPSTLQFGATKSGATLLSVTPAQTVRVSINGATSNWTASGIPPWLQLSNATGSAPGQFTAEIINPGDVIGTATALSATITLTPSTAGLPSVSVIVSLTVEAPSAAQPPIGSFDTPSNGATVAGSIAVTGWALDEVAIDRVEIWRDPIPGETTPVYAGPGPGFGKIFIASPFFIDGARPDVENLYPSYPFANRAGWGYLLLTQGLANQGNGVFTLYAFAYDQDGHSTTLGSKTITSDNAHAVKPFGALDTPTYGQTVTSSFWNYGWALTPNATPSCIIPPTGVQVGIDSGPLSTVDYGANRMDIADAFPGLTNSDSAGGAFYIDTTTLTSGTHQIGWLVTDSCGRADGIGSRFFTVLNGGTTMSVNQAGITAQAASTTGKGSPSASVCSTCSTADSTQTRLQPLSSEPVEVRRGADTTLSYPTAAGSRVVILNQGERVEVQLPRHDGATYTGAQLVKGKRRALPLGSSLDAARGIFYWQPAVGFLGSFELEFAATATDSGGGGVLADAARAAQGGAVAVRVVVGTAVQAAIDAPRTDVASPFVVSGWAVDLAAARGTGIDTVHVWAYPATGGSPIFLGVTSYGEARPDVAARFGDQFLASAYSLPVTNLEPATYDIVVYPHSAVTGDFHGAMSVRISVR